MPLLPFTFPQFRRSLALVLGLLLPAMGNLIAQEKLKITDVQSTAPIKNFRLPTFTVDGWRDMVLRAKEARVISPERIEVGDMQLTLYTNDAINQPETTVSSPQAIAFPSQQRVEGHASVHVKRNDFELTGSDWTYDHLTQKITIGKNAHVIMQIEISDILK